MFFGAACPLRQSFNDYSLILHSIADDSVDDFIEGGVDENFIAAEPQTQIHVRQEFRRSSPQNAPTTTSTSHFQISENIENKMYIAPQEVEVHSIEKQLDAKPRRIELDTQKRETLDRIEKKVEALLTRTNSRQASLSSSMITSVQTHDSESKMNEIPALDSTPVVQTQTTKVRPQSPSEASESETSGNTDQDDSEDYDQGDDTKSLLDDMERIAAAQLSPAVTNPTQTNLDDLILNIENLRCVLHSFLPLLFIFRRSMY